MKQLLGDIQTILHEHPAGLMAKDIAKKLGVDKRSVNRVLYNYPGDFKADNYVWTTTITPEQSLTPYSILIHKKYRYYNCNPFAKSTDDCVIRSICAAEGESWEKTFRELTEYAIRYGDMLNTPELYGRYLEDRGWKRNKQPRLANGKKVRIADFLDCFGGCAVAHAGNQHLTYIAEGSVWDIWDCSNEILGVYWTYNK